MNTPYFLWDYQIKDDQMHAILRGKNEIEKQWLIARILTHAKYEDIWKYLTVDEIVVVFQKLRLPEKTKQAWIRALTIWGYHV